MKISFYCLLLAALLTGCGFGTYPNGGNGGGTSGGNYPDDRRTQYPPGSNQPGAGRPANPGVRVTDIRLSGNYTVLRVSYVNNDRPRYDQEGRALPTSFIAFDPNGRLVAANGARAFRFIRAEGIPIEPQQRNTFPGDRVDFVLYFERLDKGLENFDLFECNDYDYIVCWNIYDLFVRNPADPVYQPQPQPNPTPNPVPPRRTNKPGETADPTPAPAPPVVSRVVVSGTVRDARTKRPISATIDYQLSSSKQSVDSVQSFASTGSYRMTLDRGQVYTYVASARGYLAANGVLELGKAGTTLTRDILLTPLTVGDKITLNNIYFEVSKADLLPASFAELNRLTTMMEDNPVMEIRLEGHTDIIGDHDANQQLSQDRVEACQRYLVEHGIAANRIQTVGYGDMRPLVKKGTDAERKVNRRVEFVILKL